MIILNLTTSLILPNYFIGCMFRPLWYIEHLLLRVSNQTHQSIHPPKPSQPNWKLSEPMLAMVDNGLYLYELKLMGWLTGLHMKNWFRLTLPTFTPTSRHSSPFPSLSALNSTRSRLDPMRSCPNLSRSDKISTRFVEVRQDLHHYWDCYSFVGFDWKRLPSTQTKIDSTYGF